MYTKILLSCVLLGISSKFLLMAEILRAIYNGKHSESEVDKELNSRYWVKGNDVLSTIELGKDFCFITGEKNDLSVSVTGFEFMKYVESNSIVDETIDKNLEVKLQLQKIRRDTDDEKIQKLIEKILNLGSELQETSPDLESNETFITVTLPFGQKIQDAFRDKVILNKNAMNNVWADCKDELIIVTPYLNVATLQERLDQSSYNKSINCTIITSDESLLEKEPSQFQGKEFQKNLRNLKQQLQLRFKKYRILYIKDTQTQAHAKLWISEKSVLITSANVLPNSQTNNFELGIYTDSSRIVQTCRGLVNNQLIPFCIEI